MPIAAFFSDLAEKLMPGLPKRHAKPAIRTSSKFLDVVKILENQGFKYVGTGIVAKAVQEHLKTPNGGGVDAFKTRDNGDLNIVGIVYSGIGDKRNYENHFVVQLDVIAQDGSLTPPKYIGLNDFLLRVQDRKIEDIFDTLPRPPQPAQAKSPVTGCSP